MIGAFCCGVFTMGVGRSLFNLLLMGKSSVSTIFMAGSSGQAPLVDGLQWIGHRGSDEAIISQSSNTILRQSAFFIGPEFPITLITWPLDPKIWSPYCKSPCRFQPLVVSMGVFTSSDHFGASCAGFGHRISSNAHLSSTDCSHRGLMARRNFLATGRAYPRIHVHS